MNEKDALGKFDVKSDEGIFLGYSSVSKAFRIFNKRTLIIEESIHVAFNDISEIRKNDLDDDVNFDSLNLNETRLQLVTWMHPLPRFPYPRI